MACSNSQELLELQKNNLIQSVRESFAVESKRLERLEKAATKEEKRLLERRFDEERQKDQQRIELLKQDFEIIQAKTTSGELQFQDKRSRLPSSPSKVKISLERFSGLDTEVDIKFHTSLCNRLEKIDQKASRRSAAPMDFVKEQKKLNLLMEKRDVLRQLITIQRNESVVRENASDRPSTGLTSRSCMSRASTASDVSFARFSNPNLTADNLRRYNARPSIVPPLKLST